MLDLFRALHLPYSIPQVISSIGHTSVSLLLEQNAPPTDLVCTFDWKYPFVVIVPGQDALPLSVYRQRQNHSCILIPKHVLDLLGVLISSDGVYEIGDILQ